MASAAATDVVGTAKNNQLLPTLIDEIARTEPDAVFSEYPVSASTYAQGFATVTYKQLANATNAVAWWLQDKLGEGKSFETLAYIGTNDLRYPILVVGAVKAGYKILLTSPRNSTEAHVNLMKLLNCTTVIAPSPTPPPVAGIMSAYNAQLLKVPSLDTLLNKQVPPFQYEKVFASSRNEPLAVLHTSGSTGLPKPIVIPHAFGAVYANMTQIEPPRGYLSQAQLLHGQRLICTLPLFHAVGLYFGLISAILNRTIFICPLSESIPTGEGIVQALKYTKVDAAFLAPSIVEEIGKDANLLEQLTSVLTTLAYTGGDLPQRTGDLIASKIQLFTVYGTSEMGHGPQIVPREERAVKDWKYIQYDEKAWGVDFRHYSEDLYELYIQQTPESQSYQCAFTLFPDLAEFSTRDLFSPHPTTPGLWAYRGRSDDIIVFLNGEKANPLSTEGYVSSLPEVRSALVLGSRRFQAALLIEPTKVQAMTVQDRAEFLEQIWPTIEATNKQCPSYAKISKSHVMFTIPNKPMVRAGKGTVMRRATEILYSKETDDLYADAENVPDDHGLSTSERNAMIENSSALQEYIHQSVLDVTSWKSVSDTEDLFAYGMDSLQTLQLTRVIKGICAISPSVIYNNPTIVSLARAVKDIALHHEASQKSEMRHWHQEMAAMLAKYQSELDSYQSSKIIKSDPATLSNARHVVMLTGSTGALGSYILNYLLEKDEVSHVYCFNRRPNSGALQSGYSKARNLSVNFLRDRVIFLTGDLSNPTSLGLDETTYTSLVSTVTLIIHNAWTVDFNLALPSYASQLAGVVNLAKLASDGIHSPCIFFASSISSVQNYSRDEPVPEKPIANLNVPASNGYGRSKHLAERLLEHASSKFNLNVGIARIGQVAGPIMTEGAWNKKEWLPSLVITSKNIGAVPDSLDGSSGAQKSLEEIDWIPIDVLANVLIELALRLDQPSNPNNFRVWHPLNPQRTTWPNLLPSIVTAICKNSQEAPATRDIQTLSYIDWLEILRKRAATIGSTEDINRILAQFPAIKLMDFFEERASTPILPVLETNETVAASQHLRDLKAIDGASMSKWIEGWLASDTEK